MKDYKKTGKILKKRFAFFDISFNQFMKKIEKVKGYQQLADHLESQIQKELQEKHMNQYQIKLY